MITYYMYFSTPLGQVLMLSDGTALIGLYFEKQKHMPEIQTSWQHDAGLSIFSAIARQLTEYFNGTRKIFDIPYRFDHGTPFQQSVWNEIAKIEFGNRQSYSGLAKLIGNPKAVRGVGGAVGRNPFVIIIPCHRVFGVDGSLTGFAAGLDRKKALAVLEHQKTSI